MKMNKRVAIMLIVLSFWFFFNAQDYKQMYSEVLENANVTFCSEIGGNDICKIILK